MATISDLPDQDILIKYCLQSKVNKTALDELLKRVYDSLDALKLVNIEDLSSQNIPMGQRRLIYHITQALINDDITSGPTGSKGGTASKKTGTAIITAEPLSQPHQDFSNVTEDKVNDSYSQTLLNSLLNHQSVTSNTSQTGTVQEQPSWSDPQIHIASATGKSTSTFYDICDFVPHALEEDLVVSRC